jgi:hypothetical protein
MLSILYDMDPIENTMSNSYSVAAHEFVAMGMH